MGAQKMEYRYPFSIDWTKEEILDVVAFFHAIEAAYEKGIKKEELMEAYRKFKVIVPGKADERNICNEFEEESGYSAYRTIQQAKSSDQMDKIKMSK